MAPEDVPPFANSAMDGFAVRGKDVATAGAVLDVVADLPAGIAPSTPVEPGQAVRIMTGAPIPDGADTIVKVEDTEVVEDKVRVLTAVEVGTSVRPAGGDVAAGSLVFAAGTRLAPMHVGVLATIGVAAPTVHRRPRVAFMSTGDELTPVGGGPLEPGMIRDSNRPMLRALLADTGAELVDMGIVPDDEAAFLGALEEAAAADVIVSTGGVSMGDYDVTKLALAGSTVDFWRIAIQPAKPFAFGHVRGSLFFGLPGNPVSVLVSFEQFLRPALLKMQGARALLRPQLTAIAGEELATDPEKTVFLRVRMEGVERGRLVVVPSGGQASNVLSAAAAADAFALVPRGTAKVGVGQDVTIEFFRSPETREYRDGI